MPLGRKLVSSTLPRYRQGFDSVFLQEDLFYPKVQNRREFWDSLGCLSGSSFLLCTYTVSKLERSLLTSSQLIIFQVTPVSATWTGKGHFNVDGTAFGLAQAGTSIALDVIVLGFPLPVIHRLHMRTRRKVAVGFILWLGSL